MARKKAYREDLVIEKAMNLFWRNGYEGTSMQMLEKEMGINKFSIYSSFGSKNGVFLESIACYKKKLYKLVNELKATQKGVAGIKEYFYNFITFTRETEYGKGCLVTNTANEIGPDADQGIKDALASFTGEIKTIFATIIAQDGTKTPQEIAAEADYLLIAMFGLSSATRMFTQEQLSHYIENIFKNQ
ncbi:TetR/AcrR family transcriptional regulator [uncultured Dokdonia sp.]|uniref:TetR/AcrR family transcriptional regulator n=1 Tax=uncultured Dokdonia sp. TaxID=575653 RepID=UPI00262B48D2|nr:TetR/AcrR family transcriptional regulator [uncultured Dokdonia sp.]